jgi:hypothetical protein
MAKPRDYKTEYARRVAQGAAKGLSRSQARGHARRGEVQVRPAKTDGKDADRLHAAYKDMRRTGSLTKSAKAFGISPERLRRAVKSQGLAERSGRTWHFTDDRPREMTVLTDGEAIKVKLANFDQASLNGRHLNAAKDFVRTNDSELLAQFIGQSVIDIAGKSHPLETDPNALHRIAASDEPFHDIYRLVN